MLGKFDVLVWCNFTVQTNLINEYIWSSVSVICCLTCISINKLNVCVIKINIILDDTSKENVRHGVVDEAMLSLICNLEVYISKFFSKVTVTFSLLYKNWYIYIYSCILYALRWKYFKHCLCTSENIFPFDNRFEMTFINQKYGSAVKPGDCCYYTNVEYQTYWLHKVASVIKLGWRNQGLWFNSEYVYSHIEAILK